MSAQQDIFAVDSPHDGAGAILSDCGTYRYQLTRVWGPGARALFVMLNPSTADAGCDDPTIRKCIGFAERWGLSGIAVVNLFAYRATDPNNLWSAAGGGVDIVGPRNHEHVRAMLDDHATYGTVVAAWGAQVEKPVARRAGAARAVRRMSALLGRCECMGRTKGGSPRHPLMLSYTTALERYGGAVPKVQD